MGKRIAEEVLELDIELEVPLDAKESLYEEKEGGSSIVGKGIGCARFTSAIDKEDIDRRKSQPRERRYQQVWSFW